jgi:hypothetical protein
MTAEASRCLYGEMDILRSWVARAAGQNGSLYCRWMTDMAVQAGDARMSPSRHCYVIHLIGMAFYTVVVGRNNL